MVLRDMPRRSVTGMTQAERSAATRLRLLEAAIDCLYEQGHARCSTADIAARAGVSRGAQLHHFPTRAELLAAALEFAFNRRLDDYARLVEQVPAGKKRVAAAIDLLWDIFQSRDCEVWVELMVAARTDEELRPQVEEVSERHREAVADMFSRLFPAPAGAESSPFYRSATKFLVAIFDGLVLHRLAGYDDGPGRADEVVAVVKMLADQAFPTV